MAETTEGVVINNEINIITKKAEENLKRLNKEYDKLVNNTKKGNLGLKIQGVEELVKGLRSLNNLSAGKNLAGQFTSIAEQMSIINQQGKQLNKTLKTLQMSTAGTSALSNKAIYSGKRDKLLYGTPIGIAYQDLKYEKQIERINKTLAKNQLALKGVSVEAQDAAEKFSRLDKYLGLTQLKLMANYAAINALTSGFKYVLNFTVQYDKELRQLQAIAAISDTGLQNLKDTIEGVANATKFTSLEVAQASTVLAQAGLSVSQIKDTLPAIANLATATGTDLATSTDVITSTLNIYELQVTEATRVTNSLTTAMNESKADIAGFQTAIQYAGNFAAQLGMTYEETAAAIAAATQAGIRSKSMLGTGLRAVLTEFLKPTDKLVAQLQSVGLTVDDINVKTKGFNNVLKTLSAAGFGAEEAFKGMERRGAAFLAALIRQTNYMDDLRMSMAGSTAAAEANETQMKSLSNQWANFQSIAATMASNGLEPITKSLSSLLSLVNEGLKLKSINFIGQVLFGATTAGATVVAAGTVVGSLKNIVKAFKDLSTAAKGMSQTGGFTQAISGLLSSVGIGKIGLVAAGIGALATIVYKVGDSFGLWSSEVDRLKASLEESNGAVEKASTELSVIANYTNRLYTEQEKLNNEAEKNIFAREMITRLPQARHYINLTNVSMDDLKHAMQELNAISLNKYVREVEKAAEATRKLAEATGIKVMKTSTGGDSVISRNEMKKYNQQLIQLAGATGGPSFMMSLPRLTDYGRYGYQGEFRFNNDVSRYKYYEDMDKAIKQGLNNIMNDLSLTDKEKADMVKSWSTTLKVMADEAGTESFFKPLLDTWADSLENSSKLLEAKLGSEINSIFKSSNQQIIEQYNEELRKAEEALRIYNSEMSEVNHTSLLQAQESLNKFTDSIEQLEKTKTFDDFVKVIGDRGKAESIFADLRKRPGLGSATDRQLIEAFIKDRREDLAGLEQTILQVGARITEALIQGNTQGLGPKSLRSAEYEYKTAMNKAATKGDRAKVSEMARNYFTAKLGGLGIGSLKGSDIDWNKYGSLDSAGRKDYLNSLIAKGNLSSAQGIELQAAFLAIDSAFNTMGEKAEKNTAKINKFEQDTREFFRVLSAGINQAERAYNSAIFGLEGSLAVQRGKVTASGDFYGDSSVFSTYQSNRLNDLETGRRRDELPALLQYRNRLQGYLSQLRSNPLYGNARGAYSTALSKYNSARASGNLTAIESSWAVLQESSRNLEKFTKEENDLSNKIEDLSLNISELTSEIQSIEEYSKMTGGQQFRTGMGYAFSNWQEERKNIIGPGWLGNFGGDLTTTALNSLETGFADLFTTIVDGSKSAGNAFKDMARSVLTAMRDIAIQRAATATVNAMFGSTDGGTTGWFSSLFGGKASGGLVYGPEKNRDSVPTMLMPGEYVLKKSAVDALGTDYLNRLNNGTGSTIASSTSQLESARSNTTSGGSTGAGGVVNVYVVGQQQQQQMTPNDVVVTITNDMLKGGQTKKLVKQIAMGGI